MASSPPVGRPPYSRNASDEPKAGFPSWPPGRAAAFPLRILYATTREALNATSRRGILLLSLKSKRGPGRRGPSPHENCTGKSSSSFRGQEGRKSDPLGADRVQVSEYLRNWRWARGFPFPGLASCHRTKFPVDRRHPSRTCAGPLARRVDGGIIDPCRRSHQCSEPCQNPPITPKGKTAPHLCRLSTSLYPGPYSGF